MIIFLRGLPGSGKTTIAKLLSEKLDWKLFSIDRYKKELMEENPDANFIKEIVPESYKNTPETLEIMKSQIDAIEIEEELEIKNISPEESEKTILGLLKITL